MFGRRLTGRSHQLATCRSVCDSYGKFGTAVVPVVPDPGVSSNGSNEPCGVWRNCRSRTPSTEMRLRSRWVTRSGIRRAGGTGWRRAFTRALELADQVGDVPARLQALWGMWAVRRASGSIPRGAGIRGRYEAVARYSRRPGCHCPGRQNPRTDAPLSGQPADRAETRWSGCEPIVRRPERHRYRFSARLGGRRSRRCWPVSCGCRAFPIRR